MINVANEYSRKEQSFFSIFGLLIEQVLSNEPDRVLLLNVLWRTHGLDGGPRSTISELAVMLGVTRDRVVACRKQILESLQQALSRLAASEGELNKSQKDLQALKSDLNRLGDIVPERFLDHLARQHCGKPLNKGWINLLYRVLGYQPVKRDVTKGLGLEASWFQQTRLPEKSLSMVARKLKSMKGKPVKEELSAFVRDVNKNMAAPVEQKQIVCLVRLMQEMEIHQGSIRTSTQALVRAVDQRKRHEREHPTGVAAKTTRSPDDLTRADILIKRKMSIPVPVRCNKQSCAYGNHQPI